MKRRQLLGLWPLALTPAATQAQQGGAEPAVRPAVGLVVEPAVEDTWWRDAVRQRDVPVRLRWPSGSGPWPVVLHSHGLGGSREGGDVFGKAWAAAGFLVVHLQHPGSDSAQRRNLRAAASAEQLWARVADVRFVIDEVLRRHHQARGRWAMVAAHSIGLAGHSFGAITVQATAGQRFPMPSALTEPRLKAFVALSPSSGRGGLSLAEQFGGITRPFLGITGSHDGDPFGAFATGESRAAVFDGLPAGSKALLWLDGADHMTFAGNGEAPIRGQGLFARSAVAEAREPAHHALVARVTSHWWQHHLLDDAAARAALHAPLGLGEADRWRQG
jgi:predicted dienelactone hydrolase